MKTEKYNSITAKLMIALCIACLFLVLFADTIKDVDLSENVIGLVSFSFITGMFLLILLEGWVRQRNNPKKFHFLCFLFFLGIASASVATLLNKNISSKSWWRLLIILMSVWGSLTAVSAFGALLQTIKKWISENQLLHRTQ